MITDTGLNTVTKEDLYKVIKLYINEYQLNIELQKENEYNKEELKRVYKGIQYQVKQQNKKA